MTKNKNKVPMINFVVKQLKFYAREADSPDEQILAKKIAAGLQDEHKVKQLIDGVNV